MVDQNLYHTPANERRITLRLFSYWEKMRGGAPMPKEEDIKSEVIQDLWSHCFIIHAKNLKKQDYTYSYMGGDIQRAYLGGELEDNNTQMISLDMGKHKERFEEIVETGKPIIDEGEFRNLYNEIIRYRQCLLPLGKGGRVEAIFGGMRYKIFPATS